MQFRRRVLVGLGLLIPFVALLVGMRAAASWRPVAITRLVEEKALLNFNGIQMGVGRERVLVIFDPSTSSSFVRRSVLDVGSDTLVQDFVPKSRSGRLEGDALWRVSACSSTRNSYCQNVLKFESQPGQEQHLQFETPAVFNKSTDSRTARVVRVASSDDLVLLVWANYIVRWEGKAREGKVLTCPQEVDGAVASDGETLVSSTGVDSRFYSARNGQLMRIVPSIGFEASENIEPSSRGSFVLYNSSPSLRWFVVKTHTGKKLWQFDLDSYQDKANMAMSPDEKLIFLPLSSRHIWQVRELATGKVLGELPLVPSTLVAASSPDGATLYCVAKGVLYRQRAR